MTTTAPRKPTLSGLLFPNASAMRAAIIGRVRVASTEDIDPTWLRCKRIHYSLIPCTSDGNRCTIGGGHDVEPIFLNAYPTLANISDVIKDFPEAGEVTLNIDIRGYRTLLDFFEDAEPAYSDTSLDLWKRP